MRSTSTDSSLDGSTTAKLSNICSTIHNAGDRVDSSERRAKGWFVASLKMRAYAQWMGLTLAERRAITEAAATRYRLASKRGKSRILDELCANTGWHRNHARKALAASLQPKIVAPRRPRPVKYGPDVLSALTVCWAVLGTPAGKRIPPPPRGQGGAGRR